MSSPRRAGPYVLVHRLAASDLGDVFLSIATEARTAGVLQPGDSAAVKIVRRELLADPRFTQLFLAEATGALQLQHDVPVRLLEVASFDEETAVAMEFAPGERLANVLQRGASAGDRLTPDTLLWIASRVAAGLHEAHQTPWTAGSTTEIIHGNLSPRSIVLTFDGQVKLIGLGFGRSRLYLPPSPHSLPFRAPELFERRADRRTDIYSLGVVLYFALTGERPFWRSTPAETREAILANKYPSPREYVANISPSVEDLLHRMLNADPAARPQAASEVRRALRAEYQPSDEEMSARLRSYMQRHFAPEHAALQKILEVARRGARSTGEPQGLPIEERAGSLRDPAAATAKSDPPVLQTPHTGEREHSMGASDEEPTSTDAVPPFRGAEPPTRVHHVDAPFPDDDDGPKLAAPVVPPSREEALPMSSSEPPPPEDQSLRLGSEKQFLVTERLGSVGQYAVFSAQDEFSGRGVLVKKLELTGDEGKDVERVRLFERELSLSERLSHPGFPPRIDSHAPPDGFIVYEQSDGLPLGQALLHSGVFRAGTVRAVSAASALSLHQLHMLGFVYGNLSAENVLLTPNGFVCLTDLTFASPIGETPHPWAATQAKILAPELFTDGVYGPAADQFALGVIMYRMLTGIDPFAAETRSHYRAAVRSYVPHHPREVRGDVDPALADITMRLLEKLPSHRFESCEAAAYAIMPTLDSSAFASLRPAAAPPPEYRPAG